MNPTLAPRQAACSVCKEVGALEHVALLLYDEDGNHLPTKPVMEYLSSIGISGTPRSIYGRINRHRKHIDRWAERGAPVVPAHAREGLVKVMPQTGPKRWIDVQQNAIDVGNEALRDLYARLEGGEMATSDVIALARLGVNAANTRGAMEQKGRALDGIDRLLELAAGGKVR